MWGPLSESVKSSSATIWALTWETLSSRVCKQHRRRPACASAQSDQRLCYSLFGKYHILPCFKQNFTILASLYSWRDWFKSRFFWNPKDRVSCVEAHIIIANIFMSLMRSCFHIPGFEDAKPLPPHHCSRWGGQQAEEQIHQYTAL